MKTNSVIYLVICLVISALFAVGSYVVTPYILNTSPHVEPISVDSVAIEEDIRFVTLTEEYINDNDISVSDMLYFLGDTDLDVSITVEITISGNCIWFTLRERVSDKRVVGGRIYSDFLTDHSTRKEVLREYLVCQELADRIYNNN